MFIALAILVTLSVASLALWVGANLATTEKRLLYRPGRLYASGDADFRRALGILLGPPLVGGNRVTTLINCDRIFPPMLEAIRCATVSVTCETFVLRDAIGAQFCEALSAAARRGVKVTFCSTGWARAEWMPLSSPPPAAPDATCSSTTSCPGITLDA